MRRGGSLLSRRFFSLSDPWMVDDAAFHARVPFPPLFRRMAFFLVPPACCSGLFLSLCFSENVVAERRQQGPSPNPPSLVCPSQGFRASFSSPLFISGGVMTIFFDLSLFPLPVPWLTTCHHNQTPSPTLCNLFPAVVTSFLASRS